MYNFKRKKQHKDSTFCQSALFMKNLLLLKPGSRPWTWTRFEYIRCQIYYLFKDCSNCVLLSLVKKHLNQHIMYYNFHFLLKKFQKLIRFITLSYLPLLNSFLFLSRFFGSLKSLNNYFFRRFAYKSLLHRFSVLTNYIM